MENYDYNNVRNFELKFFKKNKVREKIVCMYPKNE